MAKVIYEVEPTDAGFSQIILSYEGHHLGSIWGEIREERSDFDKANGIICVKRDDHMIAMIWDAEAKDVPVAL